MKQPIASDESPKDQHRDEHPAIQAGDQIERRVAPTSFGPALGDQLFHDHKAQAEAEGQQRQGQDRYCRVEPQRQRRERCGLVEDAACGFADARCPILAVTEGPTKEDSWNTSSKCCAPIATRLSPR